MLNITWHNLTGTITEHANAGAFLGTACFNCFEATVYHILMTLICLFLPSLNSLIDWAVLNISILETSIAQPNTCFMMLFTPYLTTIQFEK